MAAMLHTPVGPVSYAVSGPTDSGRPDLVLVHGWCCDRSVMAPLAEHFSRGHRVAVLDLRGHGASLESDDDGSTGVGLARPGESDALVPPPLREVTIADYARDVLGVCRAGRLRSPVVIGHSMGGLVALEALRGTTGAGSLPRGAVLLDPAPVLNPRGKQMWVDSAPEIARDHSGACRRSFFDGLFLPTDRVGRDRLPELAASVPATIAAAAARAMAGFDGERALRELTVPLLVLHAASVERGLREAVPDRSLVTTGQTVGAGHFHHLEVPEQVIPMVERWLATTFGS